MSMKENAKLVKDLLKFMADKPCECKVTKLVRKEGKVIGYESTDPCLRCAMLDSIEIYAHELSTGHMSNEEAVVRYEEYRRKKERQEHRPNGK